MLKKESKQDQQKTPAVPARVSLLPPNSIKSNDQLLNVHVRVKVSKTYFMSLLFDLLHLRRVGSESAKEPFKRVHLAEAEGAVRHKHPSTHLETLGSPRTGRGRQGVNRVVNTARRPSVLYHVADKKYNVTEWKYLSEGSYFRVFITDLLSLFLRASSRSLPPGVTQGKVPADVHGGQSRLQIRGGEAGHLRATGGGSPNRSDTYTPGNLPVNTFLGGG